MKIPWIKNKRILITGGFGFIGKSLTQSLLQAKANVVLLDKNVSDSRNNWSRGALVIKGDVSKLQTWEKVPPCQIVYHFAAPSSVLLFNEHFIESTSTTLVGLINAFNWSKNNHVEKFIYPSSGSIFRSIDKACSEETHPNPANTYGDAKLASEYIARIYSSVPSIGLRIFAGYGPNEDKKGEIASVVTLFLRQMLRKKAPIIYGDGSQTRDFIYIDDIVDTLLYASQKKYQGVMNVGSGESTSFNDLISMINTLLNTNIKPKYIAKPQNYLQNTRCNPKLLLSMLKRNPISLRAGIIRYLQSSYPESLSKR